MSNDHSKKLYEVTGPRLLTFRDAVHEIGRASDRIIGFQQIPIEEYKEHLIAAQVPPEYISLLQYLFTEVLDGRNASIAHGVEQALGRKPRDFSDFVKRTLATGVWSPQTQLQ